MTDDSCFAAANYSSDVIWWAIVATVAVMVATTIAATIRRYIHHVKNTRSPAIAEKAARTANCFLFVVLVRCLGHVKKLDWFIDCLELPCSMLTTAVLDVKIFAVRLFTVCFNVAPMFKRWEVWGDMVGVGGWNRESCSSGHFLFTSSDTFAVAYRSTCRMYRLAIMHSVADRRTDS